jgi:hypothetical protein
MTIMALKRIVAIKGVSIYISTFSSPYPDNVGCHITHSGARMYSLTNILFCLTYTALLHPSCSHPHLSHYSLSRAHCTCHLSTMVVTIAVLVPLSNSSDTIHTIITQDLSIFEIWLTQI